MPNRISRRSLVGLAAGAAGMMSVGRVAPAATGRLQATPEPSPIEHPTGSDQIVVRIEDEAGDQRRLEAMPGTYPSVSIYGDGRVITPGPQILIYPPPALPNLRQVQLTEEGLQSLLGAAAEAGLIGQTRSYGDTGNAPALVFTVHAGGEETVVRADVSLFDDGSSLTPQEQEELVSLQRFNEVARDLASWLPDKAIASGDEPYPIERIQVIPEAGDLGGATPAAEGTPGLEQPPMDWPLSTPLADFGEIELTELPNAPRCGVVSGDDAQALVSALEQANELTPWTSEGESWRVSFRPLLPDEQGCSLAKSS